MDAYGGIELLVSTWAEALSKAGQSVTVACPIGSKLPEGVKNITTVDLPDWQDRDDVTDNILHLDAYKDKFDVVHDFSHKNVLKDRAVHMVWNPVSVKYPFLAKNRQVTLSEWQKGRFRQAYGQDSRIMPMWIDTDKMKPVEHPIRERLLYFGAIVPAKGALLAIDYAKKLGLPLDVAGGLIPSELGSEYLKLVREACDGEKIRLHFNVSEEKKRELIQNAKAAVYPVQQAEAHWMTGMECWICGTPTLTMDLGAMREITHISWGMVANNPESFKYWMAKMAEKDFWKDNGAVRAYEWFSIHEVLPKWVELYHQIQDGLVW